MIFVYLILGIVVGFIVGWVVKPSKIEKIMKKSDNFFSEQEKQKQENLEKARNYIKGKEKITNNDIQKLLGVSDATTIRYLDELEKEGLIKQVGKSGPLVHYEVK